MTSFPAIKAPERTRVLLRPVPQTDHASIGKNCRECREFYRVTLREISRQMHVTPSFVSRLETGERKWSLKICDRYYAALARAKQRKTIPAGKANSGRLGVAARNGC